jgi:hypothetical protein
MHNFHSLAKSINPEDRNAKTAVSGDEDSPCALGQEGHPAARQEQRSRSRTEGLEP